MNLCGWVQECGVSTSSMDERLLAAVCQGESAEQVFILQPPVERAWGVGLLGVRTGKPRFGAAGVGTLEAGG